MKETWFLLGEWRSLLPTLCGACLAVAGYCTAAAAAEERPPTLQLWLPGEVALELVLVPGGAFTMGSTLRSDETPPREVTIDHNFYMGKYPVTQAQWAAVMGQNPAQPQGAIGPEHPAHSLSWEDAQAFVEALNALELGVFRLPSEAEWEYACRAGSLEVNAFGADESLLGEYGWYVGNSGGSTQPVGGKRPNAFGLHDMQGNVWEWVQDLYHPDYEDAPTDGSPREEGATPVLRGGAFLNASPTCRCTYRNTDGPRSRQYYFGLRIVREEGDTP